MENSTFIVDSLDATLQYARKFASSLSGGEIIALRGDLGAGKTTFSQEILQTLGAAGPFTSPTFTIIKQYDLSDESSGCAQGVRRVFHIDAYRVTDVDMVELGWQEMVDDVQAVMLIEWPGKIAPLIPARAQEIFFETVSQTSRRITLRDSSSRLVDTERL